MGGSGELYALLHLNRIGSGFFPLIDCALRVLSEQLCTCLFIVVFGFERLSVLTIAHNQERLRPLCLW